MKVLSLFDGMSCGRIALERAGLPISLYFASELDKHAITVAQKNYPSTVQLGDVRVVREMAEAGFFGRIDLLIGGSPCQGFSFSGKQLAFDDPRSALFFEFVRILRALQKDNPNIKFMLENVKMAKQHLNVITSFLGVNPVFINSALVSAQNRQRYYWANWPISQPADRSIFLKDIIEEGVVDNAYVISEGQLTFSNDSTDLDKSFSKIDPDKAGCMTARQYANWKGNFVSVDRQVAGIAVTKNGFRPFKNDGHKGSFSEIGTIGTPETKSMCITSANPPKITGGAIRGRYEEDGSTSQRLEINDAEKSNALTTVQKDSVVVMKRGHLKNVRSSEGKANCLLAGMSKGAQANGQSLVSTEGLTYRKLTPVECERLQTLPDNYTAGVSDTQRYKMLGNGWTVEVIAHIFRGLRND